MVDCLYFLFFGKLNFFFKSYVLWRTFQHSFFDQMRNRDYWKKNLMFIIWENKFWKEWSYIGRFRKLKNGFLNFEHAIDRFPRNISKKFGFGFMNPEDGPKSLSRSVGKKLPCSLRNGPEECSSQLFHGLSLKSRTQEVFSVEEFSDPVIVSCHFFFCGVATQGRPWPPHSWGF